MKFLLTANLLLLFGYRASACIAEEYSPASYCMYRVYLPSYSEAAYDQNIEAWADLMGGDVDKDDILQVVYKMSLEEFQKICAAEKYEGDNSFIKRIKDGEPDVCEFLLLAKSNEHIRFQRNSRWYYPSMNIGGPMSLEEVAEKALSAQNARLRDRYLLQAVRALTTLGRCQECVDIWEGEASLLPADNLMRRMIQPYIAGAEYKLGRKDKSAEYYAGVGDFESVKFCLRDAYGRTSMVDVFEMVYRYSPNAPDFASELQRFIRNVEVYCLDGDEYKFDKLYRLSLRAATEGKSDCPAMWYYTAAFVADYRGDVKNALRALAKAEAVADSAFIEESIKVMRIYLDAKTMPLNAAYESRLFEQLQWLDGKIKRNLTDEVENEVGGIYKQKLGLSFYYWNDMMRKILLGELCPRMIKAGHTTRALQLANMADNHLLGVVDCVEQWSRDRAGDWHMQYVTLDAYRHTKDDRNEIDFCNYFFKVIEMCEPDDAIAYAERTKNPRSEFDRFLTIHSYVDSDYLNDIIGTLCLRSMRYAEAEQYLGKVGEEYVCNLKPYFKWDYFSFDRKPIRDSSNYKYNFAREMSRLEEEIKQASDPNIKAELLYKFAIGLQNSFHGCWALTSYHQGGWNYFDENYDYDKHMKQALERSRKIVDEVLRTSTAPEFVAMIHYDMCNFKTIARDYPLTEYGLVVRGSCDKLIDYHAENRIKLPYATY